MIEETWKPIEGYPGYDISDLGRVRSYRIQNKSKGCLIGNTCKIRKLFLNKNGYYHICLTKYNGKQKTEAVHRLVANAFLGKRPDKLVVCHNDGNKANNIITNLRYDTQRNNHYDAVKLGTKNNNPSLHLMLYYEKKNNELLAIVAGTAYRPVV